MKIPVDIWLRGTNVASTETIDDVAREPEAWVDEDVRVVLEGMLKAMHRRKHAAQVGSDTGQGIALRGLSWIVNPYEDGGVVIAIEITMGAAVAGPINIDRAKLEAMIARVMVPSTPASHSVH
jgi:hypothetical protein